MDLILAFSLQDQVEKYGAYVGLAAFLGLAVLSLLYFAQARELKRLRDWAGRAPERALELEARVVAQAEEALREAEAAQAGTGGPAVPVAEPAAAAAGGNGGQVAAPAAIPMGPRPATAVAAAAERAQATVEAPVVPAVADGEGPPAEDEPAAVIAGDDEAAAPVEAGGGEAATAPSGEPAGDEQAAAPPEDDDRAVVPADEDRADVPEAPPGEPTPSPEESPAEEPETEPARSENGVPATPPTQIPRATPRPQPKPVPAAAPLRASTASRPVTLPPRRSAPEDERGSRVALYTVLGILVLAAAIFVPVYFMVLADDDEPAPQPNPIAEPGGSTSGAEGAGTQASEARPEKVVVVLNGTPIDGLASGERDKLIEAGYSDEQGMIRTDNNADQTCQDSVVYYGDGADGRRQARDVSRLLDITRTEQIDEETQALADSSDQSGSLPADVVALLCADKSP